LEEYNISQDCDNLKKFAPFAMVNGKKGSKERNLIEGSGFLIIFIYFMVKKTREFQVDQAQILPD
jgi:hypothetical protein